MQTVLLVEDEDKIREIQKRYFIKAGFEVLEAIDGEVALRYFNQHEIDVIILDLNLPVLDGISICQSVRKKSAIPILMVTAKSSEMDELNGLSAGADDYILKPFSPKVLIARTQKLLERNSNLPESTIIINDLVIDKQKRQIFKNGEVLKVTPTQLNMLFYLADNKGVALSRDQLIEHGYGQTTIPDV